MLFCEQSLTFTYFIDLSHLSSFSFSSYRRESVYINENKVCILMKIKHQINYVMVRTIVNEYKLYFSKVHFWPTAVIVIIECLSCSGHLNKHFFYIHYFIVHSSRSIFHFTDETSTEIKRYYRVGDEVRSGLVRNCILP